MSNAKTIPEQRQAIYDALIAADIGTVEKYPRQDPVPPVTMINDPRIVFPDNSFVGAVDWSIWMMAPRKVIPAVSEELDIRMPKVLLALSHGIRIGFVLDRVENYVRNVEGLSFPGYTIYGSAALANC